MMLVDDEASQLLTCLGCTETQKKIYLTLLKLDEANATTLSRETQIPRSEVYRTLSELQKKGLAEKEISTPYKFRATPLDFGLQILINQQVQRCKEVQTEAKKFFRENQICRIRKPSEKYYNIKMIESKERILQIMKSQHRNVQRSSDITSTFQRWLDILDCCFEDYEKALQRDVKYRIVIEKPNRKMGFPEKLRVLLNYPNFRLKLSRKPLGNNLAIFDGTEATFNVIPSKALKESPIIWTNRPGFILMAQDHFDHVWRAAREYKFD
jgi:sugar-specific transcriptional regulator TrmB